MNSNGLEYVRERSHLERFMYEQLGQIPCPLCRHYWIAADAQMCPWCERDLQLTLSERSDL